MRSQSQSKPVVLPKTVICSCTRRRVSLPCQIVPCIVGVHLVSPVVSDGLVQASASTTTLVPTSTTAITT